MWTFTVGYYYCKWEVIWPDLSVRKASPTIEWRMDWEKVRPKSRKPGTTIANSRREGEGLREERTNEVIQAEFEGGGQNRKY